MPTDEHAHTNRLSDETSPYLLQHAHNPVDWYPWGEEALERAKAEDKPIFLSIGYSACHWCHVMERESFEDEAIAEYLNDHFVAIKVDREERPDIDRIYMNATQMLTGQGGWPMSVFLTPDLEPFYAGTYFPPEDKYGRPGFSTVLEHIAGLWEEDRERVDEIGRQLTDKIDRSTRAAAAEGTELDGQPIETAVKVWQEGFDARHGGFGQPPKFPPSMQLRLMMQVSAREEIDDQQREGLRGMTEVTLARMASGGMYDQIGGGFHRYSVDERWLVPHFEKMLYDNALLTLAYTDAHRIEGRDFYRRIVSETLEYVEREMVHRQSDAGTPFYSTQDADSEGEEGKYFVWTPEMLREVLDDEKAERAADYWGITEEGNFEEGWSIPNRLEALDAEGHAAAFDQLPDDIRQIRRTLFEARSQRVAPETDTKVLAAWNGLMIRAFAYAGFYFDDPGWVQTAESAAEFVCAEMIDGELDGDFELMRTYKDGRARITGYLDDYAGMCGAFVELFEATGDRIWLERAERMADRMIELFGDEEGGFFFAGEHHDNLIVRDKDQLDNATPSGNSLAIGALLRLGLLTGDDAYRERAAGALETFYPRLEQTPQAAAEMLQGLDFLLGEPVESVLVEPDGTDMSHLVDALRETYVPHGVRIPVRLSEADLDAWAEAIPLVEGREPVDGAPTAYICRGGTCRRPVVDPDELPEQLM